MRSVSNVWDSNDVVAANAFSDRGWTNHGIFGVGCQDSSLYRMSTS